MVSWYLWSFDTPCNTTHVSLHTTHRSSEWLAWRKKSLLQCYDVTGKRCSSTFALDNGKDRLFRPCLLLPSSHCVPDELMYKHRGLNRLLTLLQHHFAILTLPTLLFFVFLLCFSFQRGMDASVPTPNTAGSAFRPEPNVAGVKTRYVKGSCHFQRMEIQNDALGCAGGNKFYSFLMSSV